MHSATWHSALRMGINDMHIAPTVAIECSFHFRSHGTRLATWNQPSPFWISWHADQVIAETSCFVFLFLFLQGIPIIESLQGGGVDRTNFGRSGREERDRGTSTRHVMQQWGSCSTPYRPTLLQRRSENGPRNCSLSGMLKVLQYICAFTSPACKSHAE